MAAFLTILSIATSAGLVYTNPPPQCSTNFRWDDCGKKPTPVIYYWKTGSRCEVGIWRGCLPNMNMFRDEYECVSTCIFAVRASAQDWHDQTGSQEDTARNVTEYDDIVNTTMEYDNSTSVNTTAPDANETTTVAGDDVEVTTGGDASGDDSDGDDTTSADGGATDGDPDEEPTIPDQDAGDETTVPADENA